MLASILLRSKISTAGIPNHHGLIKRRGMIMKGLTTSSQYDKVDYKNDGSFLNSLSVHVLNFHDLVELAIGKNANKKKDIFDNIYKGKEIPNDIVDNLHDAAYAWARKRGAVSTAHWGSPIRGPIGLLKHDTMMSIDFKRGNVMKADFGGSGLFISETDGSSFPNGGLRATHSAGAYLTWDIKSPLFIRGDTLYIPSAFVSFNGDALDEKTPLLRSEDAVSNVGTKLLELLGEPQSSNGIICNVGWEQEFFLVDKDMYLQRPDLQTSGRSLIGAPPPRGQQTSINYFANLAGRPKRVLERCQAELIKLGVSLAVYHNEVAPSQVELSPVFTATNVAADTNPLAMDVIRDCARAEGMVALFHEKPFKNINGSGKHCNWGLNVRETGRNLFVPGKTKKEQEVFIAMIACLLRAVNVHGDALRVGVASAGNDHRLGAHEAPPAIISLYLGKFLGEHVEKIIANGGELSGYGQDKRTLDFGSKFLLPIKTAVEDRNRTAPFPFCGNRFELRAVGSDMSIGFALTILHAAMAESMDLLAADITALSATEKSKGDAIKKAVQKMLKENIRAMFNGNGYSEEWQKEAANRGLPNLRNTVDAVDTFLSEKNKKMFSSYKIFSPAELQARQNILYENYTETLLMEANCMVDMLQTGIIPACAQDLQRYQGPSASLAGGRPESYANLAKEVQKLADYVAEFSSAGVEGAQASRFCLEKIKPQMAKVRTLCDDCEGLIAQDLYPFPTYQKVLFDHHEDE